MYKKQNLSRRIVKKNLGMHIKKLIYLIFFICDTLIWLFLKIIWGKALVLFIRKINFVYLPIKIKKKYSILIKKELKKASLRKIVLTSCLSKSITCKIFLNLINSKSKLYLGINKFSNGKRIPHAWLVDTENNENITPGITPKKGLVIYCF